MKKKKMQDSSGMVDISNKSTTARSALATATIKMSAAAFKILMTSGSPKGDVFETAKVAAIMAAKSTPALIPLCHPLILNKVNIRFETYKKTSMISVIAQVKSDGKTGVEMEALTASTIGCLTIYDMCKWADKDMTIGDVKLLEKSGGQSGHYKRA